MGILSSILGGGVVEGVSKIVDQFVESPSEANAHELKTQALLLKAQAQAMEPQLAQIAVNEKAAQHASVFVAGARPATLWLCALCMGGIVVGGVWGWWTGKDVSDLYYLYGSTVAPAHLGLLGLRSWEKNTGTARHSIKPKNGGK